MTDDREQFDPELETAAQRLLEWGASAHPGRAVLSVSFGGGGLVLAHMVGRLALDIPVVFLDTGFHFAETYTFRNAFTAKYGLRRIDVEPEIDVGPLYRTDPERCCKARKVDPMNKVLEHADLWITALRRDQNDERRAIQVAELVTVAGGRSIRKLNPLADWTRGHVEAYGGRHGLPRHPLTQHGYVSIGCWPCTRPVQIGAPERSGRWVGLEKTECGLHTLAITRHGAR
jgi:phosphoadenosine phosphosulfate reductase